MIDSVVQMMNVIIAMRDWRRVTMAAILAVMAAASASSYRPPAPANASTAPTPVGQIGMLLNSRNNTHTHTHTFNGPLSGTTRMSQCQKGKTNLLRQNLNHVARTFS